MIRAFELARYPVTNEQWAQFIAADGYRLDQPWWDAAGRAWLARDDSKTAGLQDWQKRDRKDQPSRWDDARLGKDHPNYPIVGVSWYEAVAFCRWLTQHLNNGGAYMLPSELEWEYACRGAARRNYAWGDQTPDGERANFAETQQGTTAVGCFPAGATPEGLFDMAGNVWEWNRSEYRDYPYSPNDGREDEQNPDQKRFTFRGGCWNNQSIFLRAALRNVSLSPDFRITLVGFRLARHPE
jgi:formylglycine-generating enzyme required for sulfatase activity